MKEKSLMPAMNVSLPVIPEENKEIITAEQLNDIYKEVLDDLRRDRVEIDSFLNEFAELVINGGDASSSSKEALVNLIKIKTEISDKKSKVADLMTRVKLKEKDTFPRYLAANQTNNITVDSPKKIVNKRELIEQLELEE